MLGIEQLPQLAKVGGLTLHWKRSLLLTGPDGSTVRVVGQGEPMNALTPLEDIRVPWTFPKLDPEALKSMVRDLIQCSEGEGFINPSPWERTAVLNGSKVTLSPGETGGDAKIGAEEEVSSLKMDTGFYNARFYHLNPLYVKDLGLFSRVKLTSSLASLQNTYGIIVVSKSPFRLNFEEGELRVQGEGIKTAKTGNWREAKPHRMAWDSVNRILRTDCLPRLSISLYKIEPSSVLPVHLSYGNLKVELGLLNLDERPVVSALYLPARIVSAKVKNFDDGTWENLEPEFDRVRVPMRRWGLTLVSLELRKLLDPLLKKKVISR